LSVAKHQAKIEQGLRGIEVKIPFPPFFKRQNVTIFDVETEDLNITVLGFYHIGDTVIHQVFFPEPISPMVLKATKFFHKNFLQPIRRLAIFNVSHEAGLFDLDRKQCIELQPMPYTAKEKYIFIQSLSKARQIPPWEPKNYKEIAFHNYSCLIKETILYLGLENFASPSLKSTYLAEVSRIVP